MWLTTDEFTATNVTLQMLIKAAYKVDDAQISGAPNWLNSDKYDVEAKWDKSILDALHALTQDRLDFERKHMLQELLAERFKLTLHREFQHLPMYELLIAENGPKLHEAGPGDTYLNGIKGPDGLPTGPGVMSFAGGQLTGQGVPIALLVRELSRNLSREFGGSIVEDKTDLRDKYDFALTWALDEDPASMFQAIQEQLGLNLELQNGPGEILIRDHVEKPSACTFARSHSSNGMSYL